ncbi:MAG: hypothetical protein V1484_00630 [bacterium]
MRKLVVYAAMAVVTLSFFSGCATMSTTRAGNDVLLSNDAPTIVVVGGMFGSDRALLKEFQKGIPGSVSVLPNRVLPLSTAADEVLRQIREDLGITGKVILVAGSWAGLIARRIDATNPGLVTAIITVGTPTGGYPAFVNSFFFGTGDENSDTPLYIIASDGDWVVSPKSALDLGQRKISDQKVFSGIGHFGLFRSSEVTQTILGWVQKETVKRETKALVFVNK